MLLLKFRVPRRTKIKKKRYCDAPKPGSDFSIGAISEAEVSARNQS